MDLSFLRRAEQRFASRSPARVDFGMLLASLGTEQSASPAARALAASPIAPRLQDPLAHLLLGTAYWREAVAAQGGSFNRALARKGAVN